MKERKAAPRNIITVPVLNRDERRKILERLDAENPEFVHMYQHPRVLDGSNESVWELESKHQEVVKNKDGKIEHHRGDPVVRMLRSEVEQARKAEGEFSRQQVESVVVPQKSTVKRKPKEQIEGD